MEAWEVCSFGTFVSTISCWHVAGFLGVVLHIYGLLHAYRQISEAGRTVLMILVYFYNLFLEQARE